MAAKLKKIKDTHVVLLDRALESLEQVLNAETPDKRSISLYLKKIEEKYTLVQNGSDAYMNKLGADNEDLEREIHAMDKLQDKILEVRFNAETILKEKEVPATPAAGIAENQTTDVTLELMGEVTS